jgi:hypothetical protein
MTPVIEKGGLKILYIPIFNMHREIAFLKRNIDAAGPAEELLPGSSYYVLNAGWRFEGACAGRRPGEELVAGQGCRSIGCASIISPDEPGGTHPIVFAR